MSKKAALVVFLLISFAVLVILEQSGKFRKPQSRKRPFVIYEPSFKEVNSFSRPVIFLGLSITGYEQMDVVLNYLDGNTLFPGRVVNAGPKNNILNAGIIGVRPDGNSFFVSVRDELVELDSDFKIKKRIAIKEFGIKDNGYKIEFDSFGQASNNYLWFSIREIGDETKNSISYSSSRLVEWELNKSPANRLISNIGPVDWITVDEANRKVFSPVENKIYDFIKMKDEFGPANGFDFMDFDPNYGLLGSKGILFSGHNNTIVRFDFASGEEKVIAEGIGAVWGFDGYVYFIDKRKQLWRCSSDGNDPMQFSSGIVEDANNMIQPPKISHDRTMLAHDFSYFNGKAFTGGTVLIDLKTHEYLILENEILRYNQMAWLIKNK